MDPHSTGDLFSDEALQQPARREQIGEQSYVLRGYALPWLERLLPELRAVLAQSPFRQMVTPGGFTMSAALSSCGDLGWTTDRQGYRYSPIDPERHQPWPALPNVLRELATTAAAAAGFEGFAPDACLINRYVPGARMSLHQDKNERDFSAPVVSLSLGLPAVFLFGGHQRSDKTQKTSLFHGDVVVWGGVDRLRFHGVLPIKHGVHPRMGPQRINLTFRKAG
ncbi:DNA oxidative demethylase AlkB [Pseudomonas proteolytica]|jgi:alkylated DNA repair protein (DNA oxidative demethylase)|uniref:Alpha-ketoglutarate-dependent dioxygenase AlkB n=1 Tax=Pseudomonas proteolytica TaxID=219574 RepID=A0AAW5AAQ3_9PSED|nr:DNA oxidative demethylase AlkB [Pseudomonas proteolytica]KAA8701348.1 DNA oxidative demethylase AlkB [Pseudomonas proteolytica]MCF5058277.1 DNA oxidative demethylase AlkB [Pseudomonas proteolytica]MCF5102523.1 DNA oxidative demethylase AlkB [Pseudomonas proteolytica]NMZ07547.1 DNA oxidative demethylase AlkB [Pseudomonas proteolytica]TWR81749.1 DNA oxidative demethylase AlkB [Pseudomonas proteolytica]